MVRSSQQHGSKSAAQSTASTVEGRLSEVPLVFEVYSDLTLAAGGIAVRVQLGPYQLLFDCGEAAAEVLVVGEAENSIRDPSGRIDLPLIEPPVDFVFCSHAHEDHVQGLWALHQAWPRLPILASQATWHLLSLTCPELEGAAACQELPWREPLALMEDLFVELFPAGHLPGAAVTVVTYFPQSSSSQPSGSDTSLGRPIRVAYSGDCFLSGTRCVPGLELNALRGLTPDLLIAEGSYGTQRYPRRRQQENAFVDQLLAALEQGRSVLMPVSSIGIAQEVILLLRSHHRCTGQDFEIWVDEPVAEGCDRYLDLLEEMPIATQNFARRQALFWDERVRPHVHRFDASRWEQPLGKTASPGLVLVHLQSNWGQVIGPAERTWELWLDRTDELQPNASGWAKHRAFASQPAASLQSLATHL